ncbi:programmed cell death protein 7-like isoform X5 [Macrobrachium rosenbergii]|uniref:programmed cell death protein 7-like isoform X5 n=1 Tax=Macrobrachium rosenbergii TaxID=79674 RepID=UPI0034D70033
MKKRHKLTVKEKKEQRELWKKEGERIDAWREKIRQVEEDKRREIAVKMEADTILGEVRQKQVDVVKMQQLLESLISLRIARLNKGAAHGFVATPQQDHLFTMTIKNIAEVVNAQMDEYKLEEQTLRVMMEESTSYRRSNAEVNGTSSLVMKNCHWHHLFLSVGSYLQVILHLDGRSFKANIERYIYSQCCTGLEWKFFLWSYLL